MKRFRLNLKNKIKNAKGMSLTEILVSIIIMLLATAVLTTVVSLGVRQYVKTLSNTGANTLFSTLQSLMTNELAYTAEIHVDENGNVQSFQSQDYAVQDNLSTFYVSGDGYGKVMIGSNAGSNLPLLGEGSYPHSLGVKIDSFTYDAASHMFTIKMSIGRSSDNAYIKEQTFQVLNVNEIEPIVEAES